MNENENMNNENKNVEMKDAEIIEAKAENVETAQAEDVVSENTENSKNAEDAENAETIENSEVIENIKVNENSVNIKAKAAENGNKKFRVSAVPIIIAAAVTAVAVIILINLGTISNTFRKATMSDDEYFRYVAGSSIEQYTAFVGSEYDKNVTNGILSDNISAEYELYMNVTDDGEDVLEDLYFSDAECFKELSVTYIGQHKDNLMGGTLALLSGNKTVISTEVIFDREAQKLYYRFPEAAKEYACIDMEEYFSESEMDKLAQEFMYIENIKSVNLTGEQIEGILKRCLMAGIYNIKDVEIGKDTLEVGDLSKRMTTMSFELDTDDLTNIMVSMLVTVSEDEELEAVLNQYSEAFSSENTSLNLNEDFDEAIDEMCEEMKTPNEYQNDIDMEVVMYVDSVGNICGYEIEAEDEHSDEAELFIAYLEKGGKFACEASLEAEGERIFKVEGDCRLSSGKITGEFTIKIDDEKIEVGVEKVDFAKLLTGKIAGTFSVEFEQFKDYIPSSYKHDILYITFTEGVKGDSVDVALYDEDELLIEVAVSAERTGKSSLKLPSAGNVVDICDPDDMEDYVDDMDFDDIEDALDDMGVEDSYDAIEEIEEELLAFEEFEISYLSSVYFMVPVNTSAFPMIGLSFGSMVEYLGKVNVEKDEALARSISQAFYNTMYDTSLNEDEQYEMLEDLKYGADITEWGRDMSGYRGYVADYLEINDFGQLEDQIRSDYSGGGIWVTYDGYSITTELRNTDCTGRGVLDGEWNIMSY